MPHSYLRSVRSVVPHRLCYATAAAKNETGFSVSAVCSELASSCRLGSFTYLATPLATSMMDTHGQCWYRRRR